MSLEDFTLGPANKEVLQHHGIVVCLVMGREHERDPAVLRKHAQPVELVRALPDLALVTAAEFLPATRIMAEPLAQTGAGRNFLHPSS
jgi:hypothetical protein